MNNWLIKQQHKYENKNDDMINIVNSDKYVDNLIDHFVNRLKILDNIAIEDGIMNEGQASFDIQLSKTETSAVECLFDYLIQLRNWKV